VNRINNLRGERLCNPRRC